MEYFPFDYITNIRLLFLLCKLKNKNYYLEKNYLEKF